MHSLCLVIIKRAGNWKTRRHLTSVRATAGSNARDRRNTLWQQSCSSAIHKGRGVEERACRMENEFVVLSINSLKNNCIVVKSSSDKASAGRLCIGVLTIDHQQRNQWHVVNYCRHWRKAVEKTHSQFAKSATAKRHRHQHQSCPSPSGDTACQRWRRQFVNMRVVHDRYGDRSYRDVHYILAWDCFTVKRGRNYWRRKEAFVQTDDDRRAEAQDDTIASFNVIPTTAHITDKCVSQKNVWQPISETWLGRCSRWVRW